ncbi:hypothetical protein L5G32_18130 [Gordonia sp. HY002]|uniref:hypothetical protein n=1 Tax=Gordonia zhenghanii TaxID=2911516 RepID=UPI001EF0550B|nr:hypothetical protein [Gordonia zhenghanii]MCF8572181.1 hypothetical protein [Gordonia zhenghanii]MCF8608164.1 hypothetical protein [Gordonia zhenghanii]
MIDSGVLAVLRGLCRDISIGRVSNLEDRLEPLVERPDWHQIAVAVILVNRYLIVGRALGDSGDYAAFRAYLALTFPAASKASSWSLEEFQDRVDTVMATNSSPPVAFEGEHENQSDSETVVAAFLLFFVGIDAWSDESWQEVIDLFEEVRNGQTT